MKEPEKCAWAGAYQNPKLIWICTDSGYRGSAYDPKGKEAVLGIDADDYALGVAVKEALEHSRFLPLEEARVFLDYRVSGPIYEARIRSLVETQRYRNKAAFFNKMKSCNIVLTKGIIKFGPTIHEGMDSWGRTKDDGLEDVLISADSTTEEIGAALRLAFSHSVE